AVARKGRLDRRDRRGAVGRVHSSDGADGDPWTAVGSPEAAASRKDRDGGLRVLPHAWVRRARSRPVRGARGRGRDRALSETAGRGGLAPSPCGGALAWGTPRRRRASGGIERRSVPHRGAPLARTAAAPRGGTRARSPSRGPDRARDADASRAVGRAPPLSARDRA